MEATLVVQPLEKGYGLTLGNALRRVLLTSIRGFAVTSIKIDGVFHEYDTIPGVREDVYDENRENIRYWECRNWVRPGWTGWQQVNVNEPIPEERLRYDLYYIKNRTLIWDIAIFFQYLAKLISGKCK